MPAEIQIPGTKTKIPVTTLLAGGLAVAVLVIVSQSGNDEEQTGDSSGLLAAELDQRLQEMWMGTVQLINDALGSSGATDPTIPPGQPDELPPEPPVVQPPAPSPRPAQPSTTPPWPSQPPTYGTVGVPGGVTVGNLPGTRPPQPVADIQSLYPPVTRTTFGTLVDLSGVATGSTPAKPVIPPQSTQSITQTITISNPVTTPAKPVIPPPTAYPPQPAPSITLPVTVSTPVTTPAKPVTTGKTAGKSKSISLPKTATGGSDLYTLSRHELVN